MFNHTQYKNRFVIRIRGRDARHFLQSLICNQLSDLFRPVFAAILDIKGIILADFFVYQSDWVSKDDIFLQTSAPQILGPLLVRYKLASDIVISQTPDKIYVIWQDGQNPNTAKDENIFAQIATQDENLIAFPDPRGDFGIYYLTGEDQACRSWIARHDGLKEKSLDDFQQVRMRLGLGDDEYARVKLLPLNWHFEALNGISWDKGCYPGQEICARIHYKGAVKREVFPVRIDGNGLGVEKTLLREDIHNCEGKNIGQLIASCADTGLAFINKEEVGTRLLLKEHIGVTAYYPVWHRAGKTLSSENRTAAGRQ